MDRQRISDLSYKEVIDLETGQRVGYIRDAEIDIKTGCVTAFIIPGRLRWLGLLGREEEKIIGWEDIQQIGEDIILLKCCRNSCCGTKNNEKKCNY